MIFTEKVKMGVKDIGKNDKIKNKAILEILENAGTYHSDLVGYGVLDIKTTKLSWILLDWQLKVIDRPKYGQTLTLNTWGKDMSKFFTYRDFEVFNEKGELCIIATSKWALMNIETGKLSRITDDIINRYKPEEKNVFSTKKMDKIEIPEIFESEYNYKVTRKDIDINQHMHNLNYLDLAYEALPEEIYNNRPYNNIRIIYKKEIKLGDILKCKYVKQNDKHIVVIESQNGEVLHALIEIF